MNKTNTLRELAAEAISHFDQLIEMLRPLESDNGRVAIAFALTIGEQFHSMLCLINHQCETHAAGPIRSMLEGVADLILLSRDADYIKQLRFDNAKADNSTIENYHNSLEVEGEIPAAMATEIKVMLEHAGTTRDALREDGMKRQTREQKFELTQNNFLYAAYGLMCTFVHPNLTSVAARHMATDNGKHRLIYRAPAQPEVLAMLLSIGIYTLTRTIELLPQFSNLRADEVQAIVADIDSQHDQVNNTTT